MGNLNLINNLIKEIPTNLKRFIIRRLRRFNVIPRASRIIEKTSADKGERAPLPERIQKQIDEALKNNPDLLKTVGSDKNETLLERLKKVFVTSIGHNKLYGRLDELPFFGNTGYENYKGSRYFNHRAEIIEGVLRPKSNDMFNKTRLTPIQYNLFSPDKIEEYKENIPEGKYSLQQGARFLKEFQINPSMDSAQSLADRFKIDPKQMMCLLTHTKIFKTMEPINKKEKPGAAFQADMLLPSIMQTEPDEERVYRLLDRRSTKFRLFYKEKLGLDQNFTQVVKNPALKKVLVKLDVMKDDQKQIEDTKHADHVPTPINTQKTVNIPYESKTIVVNDLKPGEDPNAWEKVPHFLDRFDYDKPPSVEDPTREVDIIRHPEDEEFDVFKVMEQQDREARKAKRKAKNQQSDGKEERDSEEKSAEEIPENKSRKIQVRGKVSSENS